VAVLSLTKAMFDESGATPAESEELVNEPMETGSVVVTVLLTDMAEGPIRVSLRSKAPEMCGCDVDVAEIARSFGGGGHRRAAGARIAGPLEDIRSKVVTAVVAALD
jgi:phosphoesterase RecJ-like protein